MAANLFLQIVVFISGIILPRFILQAYGSSINGMITSVNQFLTYLGLAEAGGGDCFGGGALHTACAGKKR